MYKFNVLLTLAIALGLLISGCDLSGSTSEREEPDRRIVFEKTFDSNTDGWITDNTSGQKGWCGDIAHATGNAGAVEPSNLGTGYAWFVAIKPDLQLPIDEQMLALLR